jgi:UTP--glucose-1-phosphate uridylyltransferase
MKQMIEVYDRYNCSVLAVEKVAPEDTLSYGIIAPKRVENRVYQVLSLVEKPDPKDAPSNLGIVGKGSNQGL